MSVIIQKINQTGKGLLLKQPGIILTQGQGMLDA